MRISSLVTAIGIASLLAACTPSGPGSGTSSSPSSAVVSSAASSVHPLITVSEPSPNDVITSPFVVRGEARGNWYFEASFPVTLLDSDGNEIVATYAEAQSDWMTTDFVAFESTLTFTTTSQTGTLVLHKDNPSGEPANDDSIEIPVQF